MVLRRSLSVASELSHLVHAHAIAVDPDLRRLQPARELGVLDDALSQDGRRAVSGVKHECRAVYAVSFAGERCRRAREKQSVSKYV